MWIVAFGLPQCVQSQYLTSDVGVRSFFQEQLGHIRTTFIGRPHESCPSSLHRKYTENAAESNRNMR